jgi:hypothetical protein
MTTLTEVAGDVGLLPRREPVLDGVEQQLVEHHRQRGGHLGRQHPERAGPAQVHLGLRGGHLDRGAAIRSTTPSNWTSSSTDIDSVSCTIAIEATRRTDSSSATRASGLVTRRAWQPQQGRDRLQVVLHPVVDLADGGVLGEQFPVPPTHLGHVAHQHQGPIGTPGRQQRQCPLQHGRARASISLRGGASPRRAARIARPPRRPAPGRR